MAALLGNLISLPFNVVGGALSGGLGGLGGLFGGGMGGMPQQQQPQPQMPQQQGGMDIGTIALIGGGLLAVVFVLKK
jgi:hypothetical protein